VGLPRGTGGKAWLKSGLTVDIPVENDFEAFYLYREKFNSLIKEQQHAPFEATCLTAALKSHPKYQGQHRPRRRRLATKRLRHLP